MQKLFRRDDQSKPQPFTIEDFWVTSVYCPLCNLFYRSLCRQPEFAGICKKKSAGWACRVRPNPYEYYQDSRYSSAGRHNSIYRLHPCIVRTGEQNLSNFNETVCVRMHSIQSSNLTPAQGIRLPNYSSDSLFSGRLVDSLKADFALIQGWIRECEMNHRVCKPDHFEQSPSYNMRLIDLGRRCVVSRPTASTYLALSYNWGDPKKCKHLKLTKDSKAWLQIDGALSDSNSVVPTTVKDAMNLASDLEESYLWVDSLCIQQDDDKDRESQLSNMGKIYSCAKLTIVAGTGTDAWAGLPGVGPHPTPRRNKQLYTYVNGSIISTALQDYHPWRNNCRWETRGWCLQEKFLSKRLLIVGDEQIYFSCKSALWSEDTISENIDSHISYQGTKADNYNLRSPFTVYESLVFHYVQRGLSNPGDILDAFLGIEEHLRPSLGRFFWGLPVTSIDVALAWKFPCHLPERRREGFPSWTWAGWDLSGTPGGAHLEFPWYWIGVQGLIDWYRLNDNDLLELVAANADPQEKCHGFQRHNANYALSQDPEVLGLIKPQVSRIKSLSTTKAHLLIFQTASAHLSVDRRGTDLKTGPGHFGPVPGISVYTIWGHDSNPIADINLDKSWRSKSPDYLEFILICRHLKQREGIDVMNNSKYS